MQTLHIGDLAKRSGVKIVTIRYYEQAGLLPECERTSGNYRLYTQEHVRRLLFVRRCRGLGFSLEQVKDMLLHSAIRSPTCAKICSVAEGHLKEVESKIADLRRLASELRRLRSACNGNRPSRECKVVAALGLD